MNAINADSIQVLKEQIDVVVVDDDKLTLEIVSWILRNSSTQFELFSDHHLALAYLINALPRLLIVDYFMPELNGIEFLHELRKHTDLSNTEIYLCSAVTPRLAERKKLHALGVNLLEKQIICSQPALLSIVNNVGRKI